jgi:hypothetical protein
MPCKISEEQNSAENIQFLAAASTFYGRAKKVAGIQFILLVPAALVASALILAKPELKLWTTFYSLSVALLDVLLLDRLQSHYRKRGASTQELFDTTLFQLNWKAIRSGPKPDGEDLARAAVSFHRKNPNHDFLKNWYPVVVSNLPLPLARLICQRAACKWDTDLRRTFSIGAIVTLAVVLFGVVLISLAGEMKAEDIILKIYAPVAPAVLWCIREYLRQSEALTGLEKLKSQIEAVWEKALRGNVVRQELFTEAREIQDCLFDGRSRHPLIYNWIYFITRRFQEDGMKIKAAEMVKEAKKSGVDLV